MERKEILSRIQELLADIIDNDELVIDETSSPSSVDDWDSLAHFQLVMELQKDFRVKFTANEIQMWKSVADIINSIESKIS